MEEKFNVRIPWIEYSQISSLISSLLRSKLLRPSLSPFEVLMTSDSYRNKGLLSSIYNILLSVDFSTLVLSQKAWHRDSSLTLTQEQWEQAWFFPTQYFYNFNILMSVFKLNARWYLTPSRLAQFYKGSSPKCWKGCGEVGTFYNAWWSCVHIRQF